MKKKNKKNFFTAVLIALIVASMAAIGYIILFQKEEPVAVKEQPVKKKQSSERKAESKPKIIEEKSSIGSKPREKETVKEKNKEPSPSAPSVARPSTKGKTVIAKIVPPYSTTKNVAIIIDDIGYDMKAMRELLDIDARITFAVLPLLNHSREAAEAAHRSNREVLLHLPMEPRSYPKEKPGAGALFTDMSSEEVALQLEKDLASVPHAAGVNNHMGSRFMSDEEKLTTVFTQLKKNNLFFIDSRTTSDSKTNAVSQKVNLTFASRRVFLDNDRDYAKIYRILMNVAETPAGGAPLIVIGHPYPETIRALRDACKVFREKGVSIVPASHLINKHAVREAS